VQTTGMIEAAGLFRSVREMNPTGCEFSFTGWP